MIQYKFICPGLLSSLHWLFSWILA